MEVYEAMAIRQAIRHGALSEEQAERLLADNIDDFRIITAQRSGENGRADNPVHPLFNRVQEVTEIVTMLHDKWIEFTDDATGETHVEKVPCRYFIAYGEWYTVTGGAGEGATGPVRRTRDEVRSGPERFKKDAQGHIHQYGAATALLARLLEVKALGVAAGG